MMIANFFVELGFVLAVVIAMVILGLFITIGVDRITDRWGAGVGFVAMLVFAAVLTAGMLIATGSGITG